MIGTISLSGLGIATAFAAGFISFLSPCVWPLVPAYLSYVSGVPYEELGANTRRVVVTTLAFVGGFTVVFALYGVSVGYLQQEPQLNPEKDVRGNVEEGVAEIKQLLEKYDAINIKLVAISDVQVEFHQNHWYKPPPFWPAPTMRIV